MRVALTTWNGSIATVADFAQRLQVVEVADGQVVAQQDTEAPGKDAAAWCARLASAGITTLVCGAISRHLCQHLEAKGIAVVDGCSGPTQDALTDWMAGRPRRVAGCHRWRGRRGCRDDQRSGPRPSTRLDTHPMIVAISTCGTDLDADLDPRFGRSRHFLVCPPGSEAVAHHDNPTAVQAEHGAGIRTAEFVVGLGVQAVVSGAVGPKAMQVLRAAGVRTFACDARTAREALAAFRQGTLRELSV